MEGKDSGENKGFAFVTFRSAELAPKAIDELNNTEFKEPRKMDTKSEDDNKDMATMAMSLDVYRIMIP
nr:hypothetical protein CFP56_49238 [Quercus suber]